MATDDTPTDASARARENVHEPGATSGPPADAADTGDEVADGVVERFGGIAHRSHGQSVVYVDRAHWLEVAQHLRDEEQFTQCVDVTAVDHLADVTRWLPDGVTPERFEVVANYLSHPRNRRVRVITQVPADSPEVPSLTGVYPGVDFAEREAFDLMGITFTDHVELTRILMPEDWVGHPLRKDDSPARVPVTFKEDPGPR